MTIEFTTTDQAAQTHGVKICVHGRGGAGKTTLVHTLPDPKVLISAESGVLSLGQYAIPQITVRSYEDLAQAYHVVAHTDWGRQFVSVALDSISEIGEQCLVANKGLYKDGRKAYGEMGDDMRKHIRLFRDLPGRHVYFSAKQSYNKDDSGLSRYGPSMPGNALTQDMPYFFDELFSLEIGQTAEGQKFRYLRTDVSLQYEAKDRSGALQEFEEPHLGNIINRILTHKAALAASIQQGA